MGPERCPSVLPSRRPAVARIALLSLLPLLAGCPNQAGIADPYRLFDVPEKHYETARKAGLPYVVNRRRNYQIIETIEYQTKQYGLVQIMPKFVSDGSSRPMDRDKGSIMAAFLHDAMYRGAPQLRFVDGYPGPWSKAEADTAYCLQLQRTGTRPRRARFNCRAVRSMKTSKAAWRIHTEGREKYWAQQLRPAE